MTRIPAITGLVLSLCALGACAPQSTPSMVNTTRPTLAPETMMQQVEVSKISDGYLMGVAERHKRYGTSTLHLALGYDETSKTYTSMNAFSDLASVKSRLAKMGIKNVLAETAKIAKGEQPVLWVTFDAVTAQAPEGCTTMPGVDHNTTRFMGEYKFGCSIDTVMTQQLYRPADLQGNSYMEPGSARRAATGLENYEVVTEGEVNEDLRVFERSEIGSQ